MTTRLRTVFSLLMALSTAVGCSRSSLVDGAVGGPGTAAPTSTVDGGGPDGGPDGGSPCVLSVAHEPVPIVDEPDRDAHTSSLVVLDPGVHQPEGSDEAAFATVVVQAVTGNAPSPEQDGIEARLLSVSSAPWPEALQLSQPPLMVASHSWSYAQMVRAPNTSAKVVLVYDGGPGAVHLSRLDVAAWSAGPAQEVWPSSSTPLDLAMGAAVGEMGIGYAGDGFGIVWEWPTHQPLVSVLDEDGQLVLGPHPVLGTEPLPSEFGPVMTWTGQAYVLATSTSSCPPQQPLCVPQSLVISRVRPASGDLYDDSGIDLVAAVERLHSGWLGGTPSLATQDDATAAAWAEWAPGGTDSRTVRLLRLDASGQPLDEVIVTNEAAPNVALKLVATAHGYVLVWPETGDDTLPDDTLGRTRMVAYQYGFDLSYVAGPLYIDATRFGGNNHRSAGAIESLRGVLLTWSGRSQTSFRYAIFAAHLGCGDP